MEELADHVKEEKQKEAKCESNKCDRKNCDKRHPRQCKFYNETILVLTQLVKALQMVMTVITRKRSRERRKGKRKRKKKMTIISLVKSVNLVFVTTAKLHSLTQVS